MDINERVVYLEKAFEELKGRVSDMEKLLESKGLAKEEVEFQSNTVDDFMIKIVYPGIFAPHNRIDPKAAFPKNRKKVAEQLTPGQYMFMYATSPEKRIIGLTKIVSNMKVMEGRWPFYVDLEWVINPKQGVKFADVGLEIRPRVGDTLFSITEEKAREIISILESQPDLDKNTLDYLGEKYSDL
ncbi:hypothetical protein ACLM5H_05140 [Fredinandcohnia humi]